MHPTFSRQSSRGTTLIEAMAALAVFSVGILGVMQMNVLASQQNHVAQAQTLASKLGRDLADAFERLPFDHPALSVPTQLDPSMPEFSDPTYGDGLVKLQDAVAQTVARPLLGAADAIFSSEGQSSFYEVSWRVQRVQDPSRYNQVDQLRILIMVRFPTPGGGTRQINTWAVKYSASMMTGDPNAALEL